jgi:hypothetical protein
VQIVGQERAPTFIGFAATVDLTASHPDSTGDVSISGTAAGRRGRAHRRPGTGSQILTTSGDISILGIGSGVTDTSTGRRSVQAVSLGNTRCAASTATSASAGW